MALNLTLHKKGNVASENLIILIHGLGAPNTTWNNDEVSWVNLFLTDKGLPNVDVAMAIYDTAHLANGLLAMMGIKKLKVGKFKSFSIGKGTFTTLEILARELKREIDSQRIQKYKKVILVGHSMGGLIAIRYLLEQVEHNQSHNIKGLISLATPYNGSSFALYSQLVKSVNNHAQIPSLEPNSIFLDETIRLWQKHLDTMDMKYKFFFGTNDNIVTENSAIPHIMSSKWTGGVPLPGDHSSILIVEDHDSTSYRNVSETVKEFIEEDRMLKKKKIEEQKRFFRAKCIARFRANGLTKEQAVLLLDKKYDFEYLKPNSEEKLVTIVGEFGVGKSFAVDRIYLDLLEKAEEDISFPIPVCINSTQMNSDIQRYIEKIIGNEEGEQWIIIDGMDEISLSLASKILEEARVAIERWENLKIVLTSRPLSIFNDIPERKSIRPLSEKESLDLINFLNSNGYKINKMISFPQNIKEAIKRPLFAIILGLYLEKSEVIAPTSIGDLLAYLIEHSLEKINVNEEHTRRLLMRLAKLTTSRGNTSVKKSEVGSIDEIKGILDSGIVIEENGYLSFVLPILTQWFAAKAIAENLVNIEEIIEKENNLDYWKYAIIILITVFNEEQIDNILRKLVEERPGFASIIIEEGIAKWGFQSNPVIFSPLECGEKIRMSMTSWVKALDILAYIIAPVNSTGEVLPIGVIKKEEWLSTSWYQGNRDIPKVNQLTLEKRSRDSIEWPSYRGARPGDNLSWYWRWTLEELSGSLSKLIKNKSLPICSEIIYQELMWSSTLKITKKGSLYSGKISIEEVYKILEDEYGDFNIIELGNNILPLELYVEYLKELSVKSVKEITSPIPTADIENPSNNWVWSYYSHERLYLRTLKIFEEAIVGYREMVDTLFPTIKNRLRQYVLSPFVLKGELEIPPQSNDLYCGPTLDWYIEPLSLNENPQVEINLHVGDGKKSHYRDSILEEIHERIKEYRPFASEWLFPSHTGQVLDIYGDTPVTNLIYVWLEEDLKSIYWLK